MQLQQSFIHLKGIHLKGYHGVLPQEKIVGNDYIINISIAIDLSKAIESDNLNDTISYAEVFDIVQNTMQIKCDLIEKVAGNIAKELFKAFENINELKISITKQNPPMGADCSGASVELHLINDKMQEESI